MKGNEKVTVKPVMNKTGCLWALFLSSLFWLTLAYVLAVIL